MPSKKVLGCRNIGRLDISNFDEKSIDLVQQSLYTFKTGDTICLYHENVYHTSYVAQQLYCFDLYQVHKKKISKDITFQIPQLQLKMKPGHNYV